MPSPLGQSLFVTGTDTGVGKTWVSCALLDAARRAGRTACAYKPVASGAIWRDGELVNEDAEQLAAAATPPLTPAEINPYVYEPPIAPHLAAEDLGARIDPMKLDWAYAGLVQRYSLVLVEGAGGWRVPLGPGYDFADWVSAHRWPVLLVVGMRLGCINHALLSAESILARRTPALGWVANLLPPLQPRADDNLRALQARMPMPLLARFGSGVDGDRQQADALLEQIATYCATT